MSVYNQNRGVIIQIIIGTVFFLIVGQLVSLQVVSNKYKLAADNNAIFRKIIYPDRGIIYDRKKRALLENTISMTWWLFLMRLKGWIQQHYAKY